MIQNTFDNYCKSNNLELIKDFYKNNKSVNLDSAFKISCNYKDNYGINVLKWLYSIDNDIINRNIYDLRKVNFSSLEWLFSKKKDIDTCKLFNNLTKYSLYVLKFISDKIKPKKLVITDRIPVNLFKYSLPFNLDEIDKLKVFKVYYHKIIWDINELGIIVAIIRKNILKWFCSLVDDKKILFINCYKNITSLKYIYDNFKPEINADDIVNMLYKDHLSIETVKYLISLVPLDTLQFIFEKLCMIYDTSYIKYILSINNKLNIQQITEFSSIENFKFLWEKSNYTLDLQKCINNINSLDEIVYYILVHHGDNLNPQNCLDNLVCSSGLINKELIYYILMKYPDINKQAILKKCYYWDSVKIHKLVITDNDIENIQLQCCKYSAINILNSIKYNKKFDINIVLILSCKYGQLNIIKDIINRDTDIDRLINICSLYLKNKGTQEVIKYLMKKDNMLRF